MAETWAFAFHTFVETNFQFLVLCTFHFICLFNNLPIIFAVNSKVSRKPSQNFVVLVYLIFLPTRSPEDSQFWIPSTPKLGWIYYLSKRWYIMVAIVSITRRLPLNDPINWPIRSIHGHSNRYSVGGIVLKCVRLEGESIQNRLWGVINTLRIKISVQLLPEMRWKGFGLPAEGDPWSFWVDKLWPFKVKQGFLKILLGHPC